MSEHFEKRKVKVAIIGGGTAGLYALGKVRRQTDDFVLINGGFFGTTCARVGCMPSKALIQVAEDFHRREHFTKEGIIGSETLNINIPNVLAHVRSLRDFFVGHTKGNTTDKLDEKHCIHGYARFVGAQTLRVNELEIEAEKIILATGSTPVIPEVWLPLRELILTTDELFEQTDLPQNIAVIGLGAIGLELGQALKRLGLNVVGFDQATSIGGIQDPHILEKSIELIGKEWPFYLGKPVSLERVGDQIQVSNGENTIIVDKVIASLGRRPNLENLGLECLSIEKSTRGIPIFNPQTMQIGNLPIFIAGDVNADRTIMHEAADEGRIAAINCFTDESMAFKRKTPLYITFTDPNIIQVGESFTDLNQNPAIVMAQTDFAHQTRSRVLGKPYGILRLYAEKETGKLRGAAMIGPKGEDLAHLLAWSIEQDLTIFDMLKMPFYHPVVEEGIQNALYAILPLLTPSQEVLVELKRIS